MTRSHEATFDVALPRERVWEVMADTQHLNQLYFGMDPGKVISRDGEKARVTGSFGIFAPEYDEYPWSFDVPKHYRSVRVFTKGALDRLETECSLEAVARQSGQRRLSRPGFLQNRFCRCGASHRMCGSLKA